MDLPPRRVAEYFGLETEPELAPRYNIAPTQLVAAVMVHPETGARVLRSLRWGLIPPWARDMSMGARLINARAETLGDKPAFRKAFAARRCILPASHFYEWQRLADGGKQPHLIRLPQGEPMALAALWERWRAPAAPETEAGDENPIVFSCTSVTCPANAAMAELHQRMPVILPRQALRTWLAGTADQAAALLSPHAGEMEIWPVSDAVNSPASDDPSLIRPLPKTPPGQ